MSRERDLMHALGPARDQAIELMGVVAEDERAQVARWEDEKPSLEQLVSSLSASYDIVKAQRKKAMAELASIQKRGDKLALLTQQAASQRKKMKQETKQQEELEDLQVQLIQLNNRLLDIDNTIEDVNKEVQRCTKADEKEIHSTRLVVLQDTRRLLQAEISGLRKTIVTIDKASRLEAERQDAEEIGFSNVSRLDEALVRTSARLDRAKQQLHFPAVKGYRFSTGNSGVFFAAHDLFISELSGRFDLDLELVTKRDGSKVPRLTVSLGGAAGEDELKAEQQQRPLRQPSRPSPPGPDGGARAPAIRHSASLPSMPPNASPSPTPTPGTGPAPASQFSAMAAAAAAARAAATTGTPPEGASSFSRPPSVTLSPFSRTDSANAAAKDLAQTPGSSRAGHAGPVNTARKTPPQPPALHSLPSLGMGKPAKGEVVASFFSGLSKRRDKLKGSVLTGGGAGYDAAAAPVSSLPPARLATEPSFSGRSAKGISKLARTLVSKADSLTERLGSKLRSNGGAPPPPPRPPPVAASTTSAVAAGSGRQVSAGGGARPPLRPSSSARDPPSTLLMNTLGHGRDTSPARPTSDELPEEATLLETTGAASLGVDVDDDAGSECSGVAALETPQTPMDARADAGTAAAAAAAAGADGGASSVPGATSWRQRLSKVGSLGGHSLGGLFGDSEPSGDDGDAWGDSLGMHQFEARPSRRGIYVQLLGEQVEVIGERGSKIPGLSMKELLLEVEVAMTAVLEYSPVLGWKAPEKINMSIIQLNHRMRGASLPLPASAIKALLGLYLPGLLTRALVASLPVELGSYVAGSGEPVKASGELRVLGQQLSTYVADLVPAGGDKPPSDVAKRAAWDQERAAAANARSLLGLSEAQANALAELFHGRNNLLGDKARPASVCELCRFYVQYSGSRMWTAMCNTWNRALQVCFEHFGVTERFTFHRFMEAAIAPLARKPLRVCLTLHRLHATLDVDVGLSTLRDFFERCARELHKKAQQGNGDVPAPSEPIETQVEVLSLWHTSMSQILRTFKSKFHSMGCSLLASADRDVFQVGADGIHYDGPLKINLPLEILVDPEYNLVYDVKLPDKGQSEKSMVALLQETLRSLAVHPDGGSPGGSEPSTPKSAGRKQALATKIEDLLAASKQQSAASEGGSNDSGSPSKTHGQDGPLLETPVVGQVSVKRISLGLKLDEDRIAELLGPNATSGGADASSSAVPAAAAASTSGRAATGIPGSMPVGAGVGEVDLVGKLMGCFGDLFSAAIDVGWKSEPEPDGSRPPQCMLKISNNEITRVRAEIESLMFQSTMSPKLAVKMIYAVVANLMLRFYSPESFQLRFWHQVFAQLYEYLGKESLDVTACLSAYAHVVKPDSRKRAPVPARSEGTAAAAAAAAAAEDSKLLVVLHGGSDASGLSNVRPFSLVNDINLLTVLDSLRLAFAGGEQSAADTPPRASQESNR